MRAAKNATSAIPIVFANIGDAVDQGFAATLARPGGNLTGISSLNVELSAKRLELLKEVLPGLLRVAIMYWNERIKSFGDRIFDTST